MKREKGSVAAILAIAACVACVQAKTVRVPQDMPSIQRAVDAVEPGDTVFVYNGIYEESLTLKDGVCVIGEDREKTVIWGVQNKPVVRSGLYARLVNVTVKGGREGILCENSPMIIDRCVVSDNQSTGIHCLISLPLVRNTVVCRNKWTGIYCESVRSIRFAIEHNVIAENGYSGIVVAGACELLIQNNVIFRNRQFGVWVSRASRKSRIVFNDLYNNRKPFNTFAVLDNSNIGADPAFAPVTPDTYDYLRLLGPALKGMGKDGVDIGLTADASAGVVENDADGDRIVDTDDRCAGVAEDRDGFEDEDGCPEFDNDDDGIYDADDECPNEPEDFDGYADNDGCPDTDNDRDGIPDALDKCPIKPETPNGYLDEDGCPDEKP